LDTIPWRGDDLLMTFVLTTPALGAREDGIGLNLLTLTHQIEEFLTWFASYGAKSLMDTAS